MAPFYFHGLHNFPGAAILSRGATLPDYTGTSRDVSDRVPISTALDSPGKIAMFYQPRSADDDQTTGQVRYVMTSDGGKTWGSPKLAYNLSDFAGNGKWINLGCVGRTSSGRVVLVFCVTEDTVSTDNGSYDDMNMWVTYNEDPNLDEDEWSTPVEITSDVNDSAAYGWTIPGPGDLCVLQGGVNAGRLVIPIYLRVTASGVGDLGLAYSDDDGETWTLGGKADGTGINISEPAICELRDGSGNYTGEVYVNCRAKDTSGPTYYTHKRVHAKVADVTQDFSVTMMQTTTAADVPADECQGSCLCDSSGKLLVCINSNESRRGLVAIWESTNHQSGTPTFTFKRELNNDCGYSSFRETSAGNYLVMVEQSINRQINGISSTGEYVMPIRFNREWLDSSLADEPMEMIFPTNEATGGALSQRGCQIRDHGPYHRHIQGYQASGVTWGSGYLLFDGTNGGPMLQVDSGVANEETRGGSWDLRSGHDLTITWMMRADSTGSGNRLIIDGRHDTAAETGYTLKLNSSGYLTVEYNDTLTGGNNVANVWASTNIADDTDYRWYLVINRTANTVQLFQVAANGTVTAGPTSSATRATGICRYPMRLGSSGNDGSSPFKGRLGKIRFLRGTALTSGEMTFEDVFDQPAYQKTPAQLAGIDRITQPTLPASYANCVTAVGATWDGGYSVASSGQGAWDHGRMPPIAGQGAGAIRCPKTGKLFEQIDWDRAISWQYSDKAGWMLRPTFTSAAVGSYRRASESNVTADGAGAADTDYDFIPSTGVGAFSVVAEFVATTGGSQVMLGTRVGNSPDLQFLRINDGRLEFQVRRDAPSTVVITQQFSVDITLGTPYYIGVDFDNANVTGNGAGKVVLYYGAYGAGLTPPTLTKVVGGGTMSISGSHVMANALYVGSTPSFTSSADWRFKNLLLFNAPLNADGHDEWAALGTQDGTLAGTSAYRRMGLGIGIGIGL